MCLFSRPVFPILTATCTSLQTLLAEGHSLHTREQKYHWTLRMLLLLQQEVSPCMTTHTWRMLSHFFSQLWNELQWDSTVACCSVSLHEDNFVTSIQFFLPSNKDHLQSILEHSQLEKLLEIVMLLWASSSRLYSGKRQKDSASSQARPKCSLSGWRRTKRMWL